MDITNAIRNPAKVHKDLKKVNNQLVTQGGCYIYAPVGYSSKDMAFLGSHVTMIGIYLITTDHKTYGVSNVTTMMQFTPTEVDTVMIGEEEYYKFYFAPGSVVVSNVNLKLIKKIIYNVVSYIYDYGRVPFWFTVKDHSSLLNHSRKWNDVTLFPDPVTHDVYSSLMQRAPSDVRKHYRHTVKSEKDLNSIAQYIPLREGPLSKSSRISKLADTELKRGIRSALLVEPTREEPLERMLMR